MLGPGLTSQLCTRHSRPRPRHSALSWSGAAQGGRRDASALTLTSIHLKCVEYQTVVTLAFCVIHSQWKYQECRVMLKGHKVHTIYGWLLWIYGNDDLWKMLESERFISQCEYMHTPRLYHQEARPMPATLRCEQPRPFYPQDNALPENGRSRTMLFFLFGWSGISRPNILTDWNIFNPRHGCLCWFLLDSK